MGKLLFVKEKKTLVLVFNLAKDCDLYAEEIDKIIDKNSDWSIREDR